ncbi:hypothetical protein [Sinomicrobium soli]|uniref:hypothetical protein n=1 Tax=Sinomicrobium sp. N-1-3-6 TaxID=2219864 RepID=UPI000DCD9A7E|nr:hypothetical protein [Sinomicrobium sp. N-1-3-6]RAV29230.1 hypothetical protein DN748_09945 [Sinomicrobium sp. N-1-3-6]
MKDIKELDEIVTSILLENVLKSTEIQQLNFFVFEILLPLIVQEDDRAIHLKLGHIRHLKRKKSELLDRLRGGYPESLLTDRKIEEQSYYDDLIDSLEAELENH